MQNDNEDLPELKQIYDELWSDAKTLAKDMRKSISMYFFAGCLTLILAFVIILSFTATLMMIISGVAGLLQWYNFVMGAVGITFTIAYSAKLLQWYRQLSRKYSKLIELEKKLEEK